MIKKRMFIDVLQAKNFDACRDCSFKNKCTSSSKGRVITRDIDQDFLDIVDARTSAKKELYKRRQMIVEHPFGTVKRGWGLYYFLTRGLASVKTEASLAFLAYNFKRVISIIGVEEMVRRLISSNRNINLSFQASCIKFKIKAAVLPNGTRIPTAMI